MELEPLLRFWRAQDDLFDRVDPAWWGAVVSDRRYPDVQEPNYARIETRQPVRLAEIEELLLPSMDRSRSSRAHVVIFHPEEQTDLIVEASTRGERISWDLVMEHDGAALDGEGEVRELRDLSDAFWSAHRASLAWFDIVEDEASTSSGPSSARCCSRRAGGGSPCRGPAGSRPSRRCSCSKGSAISITS
ncbi:MAG: hypothetical protein ACRDHU_07465 [Actinomycetota bacterium]